MKWYEFTVSDALALPFSQIWGAAHDAAADQEMFELQMDGEEARPWPPTTLFLVAFQEKEGVNVYNFEVHATSAGGTLA